MQTRLLTFKDIPQLVLLFDAYRQFYRMTSDLPAAEAYLSARMENKEAILFGAFNKEEMIGFTLLFPLYSSTRMQPIYLLNDLFVNPIYRNQSIGKAILLHAQEFAKQQGRAGILLETEKTNAIGNHLYPAMGFEPVSGSNFYFWEKNKN